MFAVLRKKGAIKLDGTLKAAVTLNPSERRALGEDVHAKLVELGAALP